LALEAESLNNFDNFIIDLESNYYVFFRMGYQTFIFGFIHKLVLICLLVFLIDI